MSSSSGQRFFGAFLALFLMGTIFMADVVQAQEFRLEAGTGLNVVAAMAGKVTIKQDPSLKNSVKVIASGKNCVVKEARGQRLALTFAPAENAHLCALAAEISVPEQTDLSIGLEAGEIQVRGVTGHFDINLGTGEIDIEGGTVLRLTGRLSLGKAVVKGLTGDVNFSVGSGSLKARYAKVPAKGICLVEINAGDATIILPADARFKSQLFGPVEKTEMQESLKSDPAAEFEVRGVINAGRLTVRKPGFFDF